MAMCYTSSAAPHLLLVIVVVATAASTVAAVVRFFSRSWMETYAVKGRSPPGPPGLPILGNLHMLGSLPHRALCKLADRYGPVMGFKLGLAPAVVVSSARAAELFLSHDNSFAQRAAAGAIGQYLGYGLKGLVLSEYGAYWRGARKLCTVHLLGGRKVDALRWVRSEEIRVFIRSIREAASTGSHIPVDISARVSALITNVVCRTLFGMKCGDALGLDNIIKEAAELAGAFNVGDYIPCMGVLDVQGIQRRMKAVRKAYDDFLDPVIDEHALVLKQGKKAEVDFDLVDTMLCCMGTDDGNILHDNSNIKAILMDMIIGAFDTSQATIDWTMSELLRHPRVLKKVQQELDDVVGMHRMVEEEDLAKLSYLGMVVKETMRLWPPIPFIPREAREDCTPGGFHIEKGTRVLVNLWAIGRDPGEWADPETFFPERFAGDGGAAKGVDGYGFGFGAGSRRCPGMRLGLALVRMGVAQLVHCFDWEAAADNPRGEVDMTESYAMVMSRANPLLAVPTNYRLLA